MVFARCQTARSSAPARGARFGRTWSNWNIAMSHCGITWRKRFSSGAGAAWMVSVATPVTRFPLPAWQYIIARVRQEFPETHFSARRTGRRLGSHANSCSPKAACNGPIPSCSKIIPPVQVAGYLDHSIEQSERVGLLVHYSETHDNDRLAKQGRAWSLAAQSALRAGQRQRRIWLHLRRGMARTGENQCPFEPGHGLGQSAAISFPNWRD